VKGLLDSRATPVNHKAASDETEHHSKYRINRDGTVPLPSSVPSMDPEEAPLIASGVPPVTIGASSPFGSDLIIDVRIALIGNPEDVISDLPMSLFFRS